MEKWCGSRQSCQSSGEHDTGFLGLDFALGHMLVFTRHESLS